MTSDYEMTDDDVGKSVVLDGETVGRVVDVRHGTAHVDPDTGIVETIEAKLGWTDAAEEEGTYPLQEETIEAVTDDEVRLRRSL